MFRNLLVNWMVLIPLIAAAAMLPRIYLGLLGLPSQPELVSQATLDWWYLHDWIPIVVLIADRHHLCRAAAAEPRPSLRRPRSFAVWFLAPVLRRAFPAVGPPVLGLAVRRQTVARHRAAGVGGGDGAALDRRRRVQRPLVAAVDLDRGRRPPASSAASMIWWAHHFLTALAHHDPQVFVVVDLPTVAGAVVPADHRLHRPRQPGHVRRRPRVVGAGRRVDSDHRRVVAGHERCRNPRPAAPRRRPRARSASRTAAAAPGSGCSRSPRAAPPTG